MNFSIFRSIHVVALLFIFTTCLSSCGKRGKLEAPMSEPLPSSSNNLADQKLAEKSKQIADQNAWGKSSETSSAQTSTSTNSSQNNGGVSMNKKKKLAITPPKQDLWIDKILE